MKNLTARSRLVVLLSLILLWSAASAQITPLGDAYTTLPIRRRTTALRPCSMSTALTASVRLPLCANNLLFFRRDPRLVITNNKDECP